jgi:hypothetical protein
MFHHREPPPPDIAAEIEFEDRTQPAIFAFNRSPRTGLPLLCESFGIPQNPRPIAHLLRLTPGLIDSVIGEFLAQPENSELLYAYFQEFRIELPFLDAFRHCFTCGIVLPKDGEASDRVLDIWARCWVAKHPYTWLNADQAHILAFAIVMLNGDLHHPDARRHMTMESFVDLIRGVIPQTVLSTSEVMDIYQTIKAEELQFVPDVTNECLALTAPKLKGSLMKKGQGLFARWRKHYFVLTHSFLYYFESKRAVSDRPIGVIELRLVNVQPLDENQIVITAQRDEIQYVKFVRRKPVPVKNVRVIILRDTTMFSRNKWVYRLRASGVCTGFNAEDLADLAEVAPEMMDEQMGSQRQSPSAVSIRRFSEFVRAKPMEELP